MIDGTHPVATEAGFSHRLQAWRAAVADCSYYEILGVLEIADLDAIKAAYREFVCVFHPDVHPELPLELSASLREVFERGVEAYRVLSDPELRVQYDLALAQGFLRLDRAVGRSLPPSVRSLEELCATSSGRQAAAKADALIGEGNLFEAQRQLKLALIHEGGQNPELEERLDAVDLALYAKGE